MASPDTFFVELLARLPLADYAVFGAVAASGAVTRYLWDCLREAQQDFALRGLLLYFLFGVFIGNFVGSFLGIDHDYRDGLLLLSGFVVKELLEVLYRYGGSIIARFLKVDVSSSIIGGEYREEDRYEDKGDKPNSRKKGKAKK